MKKRSRASRFAHVARIAAMALAAGGVVACAAILGIDDREPLGSEGDSAIGTDGTLAVPDAPRPGDGGMVVDGSFDGALLDGPTHCDPTQCGAVKGGVCTPSGACAISCASMTECPPSTVIACPPGHDCQITCGGTACDKVQCTGGRSCSIDCSAMGSCHNGVICKAEQRCQLDCKGAMDSCGGGGGSLPATCEAGVCIVNCSGPGSCSGGVSVSATTYCGISCSGATSCAAMSKPLSCGSSPDASIVCGTAANTCQKSKPSCFGAYCEIDCLNAGSCTLDYCCEAGTCVVDAAASRTNVCP